MFHMLTRIISTEKLSKYVSNITPSLPFFHLQLMYIMIYINAGVDGFEE